MEREALLALLRRELEGSVFLGGGDLVEVTEIELGRLREAVFAAGAFSMQHGGAWNAMTLVHTAQSEVVSRALAEAVEAGGGDVSPIRVAALALIHDIGRLEDHPTHMQRGHEILTALEFDPQLVEVTKSHYFWGLGYELFTTEELESWTGDIGAYVQRQGLEELLVAIGESSNRKGTDGPIIAPLDEEYILMSMVGQPYDLWHRVRDYLGAALIWPAIQWLEQKYSFSYPEVVKEAAESW